MSSEAIIEIRAGAGGNEAALFAADLFNMYKKYAQSKNWRLEIIDYNQNDLGGYKSMTFEMKGEDVLKFLISFTSSHEELHNPAQRAGFALYSRSITKGNRK